MNNRSDTEVGYIKAIDLMGDYKDQKFKIKDGRVVWEAMSMARNGYSIIVSRICETGGRPWMLGLRYKRKWISPETLLEPINVCPYCFDPECTSDHK